MNEKEISEYRKKWGIPDWKDPKKYSRDLCYDGLRWEFLRRRKDVRDDWDEYSKKTYYENSKRSKDPKDKMFDKKVLEITHPDFRANVPDCNKKYHLNGLPNPNRAYSYEETFGSSCGFIELVMPQPTHNEIDLSEDYVDEKFNNDLYYEPEPIANNYIKWIFDIDAPLNQQISEVSSFLQNFQRQKHKKLLRNSSINRDRKINRKWAPLLRALDARNEGVKLQEIGRTIFKYKEMIKEILEPYIKDKIKKAYELGIVPKFKMKQES